MFKVLILTHCYPPDGGSFIKHRAKLIDAQVLTMARPLNLINFIRFVNDAVGSARKYDMIEAHWMYPAGIAARIASKLTGVPYRVYCHGTDVMMSSRSWFWRWIAGWVTDYADEVRCVSKFLAGKSKWFRPFVPSRDGWRKRKIVIDPMDVDKSIFYNRGQIRCGVKAIVKRNIGRYRDVVDHLIPIGCYHSQAELADIFNHTSVIVLASENEGYGLMLAEAAECGCKIIGVNEGGIPEVVAKYDGLLFDGTAEDLRKKINIALNGKDECSDVLDVSHSEPSGVGVFGSDAIPTCCPKP